MIEGSFSLNMWERFIKEGILEESRLNKRIIESWYRCRSEEVNPNLKVGQHVLNQEQLEKQRRKNSFLIHAALPYMNKIEKFIQETSMVSLLIDAQGYILSMNGAQHVLEKAREINFTEGSCWTEKEVGTNAIGTALQNKEAMMVTGAEHYAKASHEWSCSSAVIRGGAGEVLGVFNISCPAEYAHQSMIVTATSAAYMIEKAQIHLKREEEIALLHNTMEWMESERPLIVCTNNGNVVGASKGVREKMGNWAEMSKASLLNEGYDVQFEVPVFSKNRLTAIGYIAYLTPKRYKNREDSFFVSAPFIFNGAKSVSKAFQHTLTEAKCAAPTEASVYLSGETGAGKEMVAKAIHENSGRKKGPFIALNCGALPKNLLESELFGYEEGAFTGAKRGGYKGKFQQASGGTLFLDEIGDLPFMMQIALLRVLQERIVTPLGSEEEKPIDVRIITATHQDLKALVEQGKFREDLYYRLHIYPVHVPSLRSRKEDIPHLVQYFCERYKWHVTLSPLFFKKLAHYDWPGNIRELFNILHRVKIVEEAKGEGVENILDNILLDSLSSSSEREEKELPSLSFREEIQKEKMKTALQETNGNITLAAKLINVPRSTFYRRLQKYNLH
ncbi:sigma-54-dependent Fis family transcriptional regulator [Priestia filamentosa]|uniref:Sigma-54-dependent Fis family transcriptional regulator n=1 Tax=Priestia filamentosa TaxID=1402861 RepID=A0A1X7E3Y3_9BACI|nr:sigma-54-dependent Fis family transcriptional regulator [Priestia filamentosa]AKO92381.1 sigma-54-dependent Fis family transcriptional regulator [Priestia filamentosa]MDT3762424.1 sigma-54-dependent Fis family transcriptional regulator [Priestia filamentosa]OXS68985.1 sigma-54-dependent Fis family transcriptional regulator [Priestia filamentosa]WRU96898.1 sigma-54-dependent Fis family transcriptional regulator [Priestia filamentosa]SMF26798.1 Transcriptional regulator of acetoin/glycerol me